MEAAAMNLVVQQLTEAVAAASCASVLNAPASADQYVTIEQQPGREQVQLPGPGREISEFAKDIGSTIGPKEIWFKKGQQVVEVRNHQFSKNVKSVVFHPLTA